MCDPLTTSLVVTTVAATAFGAVEAKEAQSEAKTAAKKNRNAQAIKDANLRAAAREANVAKELRSAEGGERASLNKKRLGKKALRAPTLGGISQGPSLGGLPAKPKASATSKPKSLSLGGI